LRSTDAFDEPSHRDPPVESMENHNDSPRFYTARTQSGRSDEGAQDLVEHTRVLDALIDRRRL